MIKFGMPVSVLLIGKKSEENKKTFKDLNEKYDIYQIADYQQALAILLKNQVDIILLNISLDKKNSIDFLKKVKKFNIDFDIITIFGSKDDLSLLATVDLANFSYLVKPYRSGDVIKVIENLTKKRMIKEDNKDFLSKISTRLYIDEFIGSGSYFNSIKTKINNFSQTNEPIIILGEHGVEKEIVANQIHQKSNRSIKPCVFKELTSSRDLEDISFLLEANAGFLILSDISALDKKGQTLLKSLLLNNEVDVRLILLSSKPLRTEVAHGNYDEELYHLFSKNEIKLLPLKERTKEIPFIINSYRESLNKQYNLKVAEISDEVLIRFASYSWPGNVAELKALLFSLMNQKSEGIIELEDLPLNLIQIDKSSLSEGFKDYYINKVYKSLGDAAKTAEVLEIDLSEVKQYLNSK